MSKLMGKVAVFACAALLSGVVFADDAQAPSNDTTAVVTAPAGADQTATSATTEQTKVVKAHKKVKHGKKSAGETKADETTKTETTSTEAAQ